MRTKQKNKKIKYFFIPILLVIYYFYSIQEKKTTISYSKSNNIKVVYTTDFVDVNQELSKLATGNSSGNLTGKVLNSENIYQIGDYTIQWNFHWTFTNGWPPNMDDFIADLIDPTKTLPVEVFENIVINIFNKGQLINTYYRQNIKKKGTRWSPDYSAGTIVEFKSDSGKTLTVYSPTTDERRITF